MDFAVIRHNHKCRGSSQHDEICKDVCLDSDLFVLIKHTFDNLKLSTSVLGSWPKVITNKLNASLTS